MKRPRSQSPDRHGVRRGLALLSILCSFAGQRPTLAAALTGKSIESAPILELPSILQDSDALATLCAARPERDLPPVGVARTLPGPLGVLPFGNARRVHPSHPNDRYGQRHVWSGLHVDRRDTRSGCLGPSTASSSGDTSVRGVVLRDG
jgi:hypothetical protein